MKTLVAYLSQTGNTKKVAQAIFDEIPGDKDIEEIAELEDLEGYEFAFVGFPINAFGPNPTAKEFLERNASGKKLAIFITHGAPEDNEDIVTWLDKCREAAAGADIRGTFNCQGEVAQPIIEFLLKSDDPKMRAFGEAGPSTKGQPDASKLERARAFARETLAKL
jgi:flavodoxin